MSKKYKYRTTFTFDGKRYQVLANSERELIEKKTNRIRDLKEGKVTVGPNMPVKTWAQMALDTYKHDVTEETRRNIDYRLEKHVYSAIGSMPIRSVRQINLQRILNSVSDSSGWLIDKLFQEIKFIFRTAFDNKIIIEDPARTLQKPSGKNKGSRRSLTEHETEHFFSVCDADPRFTLFLMMYHCGCRPGEAIKAIGKDIEMKDGAPQLHIRGTKSANADRYVPIPSALYEKIKDTPPFAPISPNRSGQPHTDSTYKRLREALYRQMNLSMGCRMFRNALVPPFPLADDFEPYCLRHTYCTNLAKAGVDVRTAQKLMGHASIQTTADIYTHIDNDEIMKAGRLIEQLYGAKNASKNAASNP